MTKEKIDKNEVALKFSQKIEEIIKNHAKDIKTLPFLEELAIIHLNLSSREEFEKIVSKINDDKLNKSYMRYLELIKVKMASTDKEKANFLISQYKGVELDAIQLPDISFKIDMNNKNVKEFIKVMENISKTQRERLIEEYGVDSYEQED